MHRTIEASIRSENTDAILQSLTDHPHVIGLNVFRQASLKPRGDAIIVHVLNRGADDVLRIIRRHTSDDSYSIVTSEVASISDPKHQKAIDHDVDEAIWEEMETGLRHNGRLTSNYLLLMMLGGIIAATGFVASPETGVISFVAASIIAPGLEPLAKVPLGLVLGKGNVLWVGLRATVVGYLIIMVSAALTFFALLQAGNVSTADFLENKTTTELTHLPLRDFLRSMAAAAASILMYLAYRRNVIAGPLIALILIPAATAVGMSAVIGHWDVAFAILGRLGADMALIIATGAVLIWLKQKLVHKREPLR